LKYYNEVLIFQLFQNKYFFYVNRSKMIIQFVQDMFRLYMKCFETCCYISLQCLRKKQNQRIIYSWIRKS